MTTHENVSPRDALDIVFANRNRAYGAYQLRREYPTNLSRALGIALVCIAAALLLPRIIAALSGFEKEVVSNDSDVGYEISKVEVEIPPPVLNTPPPPPQAAVAYKPPVVAPDNQVSEVPQTDVQTLLEDPRAVGTQTVEGPGDAPPSLDPPGTGLGIIEAPKPADDDPVEPFAVNKMPSFPGGEAEMFKWIYKHIVYPEMAREAGTEGSVSIDLCGREEGSISDIAVVKTPAGGNILGKEATRVVQEMPKWTPGEANGHPVKVRFTLPIRFALK